MEIKKFSLRPVSTYRRADRVGVARVGELIAIFVVGQIRFRKVIDSADFDFRVIELKKWTPFTGQ